MDTEDVRGFFGFTYRTGEIVRLGDRVLVRRFLRRPLRATVVQIYDPLRPSPPKGDNDVGYHIQIENGTWGFVGSDDPSVIFVARDGIE
jgi:hypothetical protein